MPLLSSAESYGLSWCKRLCRKNYLEERWRRETSRSCSTETAAPSRLAIHVASLLPFHAGLTKKAGTPPHIPARFMFGRMAHQVREESVKVPEMGKRSACYHSLRKAYAPEGVHKRRR